MPVSSATAIGQSSRLRLAMLGRPTVRKRQSHPCGNGGRSLPINCSRCPTCNSSPSSMRCRRCAMRSNFMAALPDAAIEILVEGFRTTPSLLSAVIVEHCHGAIARVAPDATAFGLRSNPYHLEILGFWDPAKEDAANLAWVELLFADMQ